MRTPIIAGNWKMNKTIKEASDLVSQLVKEVGRINNLEVVIAPPFTALRDVYEIIKGSNISLAAQNMHWEEKGAYTGEVSSVMIKDIGCKYVIIGHSERREYFYESDEIVNKKVISALKNGLIPIICVGEKLNERERGEVEKVIKKQIKDGLKGLRENDANKIVIAYEPVWAIGTGKNATPDQAEEVHRFIRKLLKELFNENIAGIVRILYGGSVKEGNIDNLMKEEDIDGALVGGASLNISSFMRIVKYNK
jgi:triosephosphate isomerase